MSALLHESAGRRIRSLIELDTTGASERLRAGDGLIRKGHGVCSWGKRGGQERLVAHRGRR